MLKKKVYVNGQPIGDARTWDEVHTLIQEQGILFVGKPGAAEGPSGFYVSASFAERIAIEAPRRRAKIKPVT